MRIIGTFLPILLLLAMLPGGNATTGTQPDNPTGPDCQWPGRDDCLHNRQSPTPAAYDASPYDDPIAAQAWTTIVEAKVADGLTGLAIPGAHVSIPALAVSAQTNSEGRSTLGTIPLPSAVYTATIVVSAPGYGDWTLQNVRLYSDNPLRLDARLGPAPVVIAVPPPRALTGEPQIDSQPARGQGYLPESSLYPPATIRVGITGQTACIVPPPIQYVEIVDFNFYVKHVLPSEWIGSWPAESLKAGAMAVKTYAWYWVNRGGKWPEYGADVVDSTCDQVYNPAYSYWKTDQAVDDTWGYRMVRDGSVSPAYYYAGEYNGEPTDGDHMTQWGSKYWADQGQTWEWILHFYYSNVDIQEILYLLSLPLIMAGER